MIKTSIVIFFKFLKLLRHYLLRPYDQLITYILFFFNGVKFTNIKSYGVPRININKKGSMIIGDNFELNNRNYVNPIGRTSPCSFFVSQNAILSIGYNVGLSSTTIVCQSKIEIGNNVMIGANVVIYDTDFHSMNPFDRSKRLMDNFNTMRKSIKIEDNVFIGAHSTILKGVSIGENSVIGACSVVTKNIPSNEIWAGNPIKFLKKINFEN